KRRRASRSCACGLLRRGYDSSWVERWEVRSTFASKSVDGDGHRPLRTKHQRFRVIQGSTVQSSRAGVTCTKLNFRLDRKAKSWQRKPKVSPAQWSRQPKRRPEVRA